MNLEALPHMVMAYAVPLTVIWIIYAVLKHRTHARSVSLLEASKEAGLHEPASLHPIFDPSLCRGCGACVTACPEGNVIGIINGKGALVEPSQCIGHGACKTVCPFGAISLVFGSETRGVDIPSVHENFESNVPGLFIAGELGGMGLIRNAIEQGRQAVDAIAERGRSQHPDVHDLIIVGAGPAGIAASLAAKSHGLRYVTLEQDTLGGTVAHFPRGKIVMTQPATLPLVGKFDVGETDKETLLSRWTDIVRKHELRISYEEHVRRVDRHGDAFMVSTGRGVYRTRSVLLSIGRRGTPRTLNVPGEDLSKVVYRLAEPEQYEGRRVLVVGGGDSAVEAALALSDVSGTEVILSYRGEAVSRCKAKNRVALEKALEAQRVFAWFSSEVRAIEGDAVQIEQGGRLYRVRNDAVIICAGGILPTAFLKSMGVEVETKYGTA